MIVNQKSKKNYLFLLFIRNIGILCKYTNVMKGYQNRYFVVDERRGLLNYYMPEDVPKRRWTHVRGSINLINSNIAPSEDDSQTFTVSTSDQTCKLKASSTKERQKWIDKLRQVAYNLECTETNTMYLNDVRESLLNTQKTQIKLVNAIENFSSLDKELLILKSTTYSSLMALENCFAIMQEINDGKL
jgi:alkyl sulfatase BDS1-like metallo-beta-lactamase superfamily hydrolase